MAASPVRTDANNSNMMPVLSRRGWLFGMRGRDSVARLGASWHQPLSAGPMSSCVPYLASTLFLQLTWASQAEFAPWPSGDVFARGYILLPYPSRLSELFLSNAALQAGSFPSILFCAHPSSA
ncbi:hypothetical protein BD311DRAFT_767013 [Dichomitus squalens]|uniref:Uncharacterized protein n=1 Tax=Dichomitus squalens TaxID=114155 RepID=A0A4V2JZ94_9APHY|nr:hypothetical protein BD311DRAFT_767013 [Dichomitus squalens]